MNKAFNKVFDYIYNDPEENLPKVIKWMNSKEFGKEFATYRKFINKMMSDPENIWYKYIIDIFKDIDKDIIKTIFRNFILNASYIGTKKQEYYRNKYNCNIPWAILIDPTTSCNLNCIGCWTAEYGKHLNLSFEEINNIIVQGKELGIYFYLYSGGEHLLRKKDIIRLCEIHPDCQFAAFTNGTLIDEALADEFIRVKNFIPIISVEGYEEDTDFRRGEGTFKKVQEAMNLLRKKHLPFGVSCCYTSKNVDVIGSEKYIDQIIEWGAKFCWLFTYIPVGKHAVKELMVIPEQREFMYNQIRNFRKTKPLFTLDFWNDGEYSNGCVAAGRRYLHINANGDIEPCAFIHYSDSNIYEKKLIDALQSPLFMAYKNNQPFNENHLRPCPLLDNPEKLVNVVETSGAYSTDFNAPEDVRELTKKCEDTAKSWGIIAQKIWNENTINVS